MDSFNFTNFTTTSAATPLSSIISPALSLSISLLGILSNIFLITVIWTDSKMKSPCFTFILGSGFASMVMAAGFALSSMGRLGFYPYADQPRLYCQFVSGYLFKAIGLPLSSQAAFLIAVDRLFGAISPVRYRQRGKQYARVALGICGVYVSSVVLVIMFQKSPNESISKCVDPVVVNGKPISQYFSTSNVFFVLLCVTGYIVMLIYVHSKRSKIYNETDQAGFASLAEKRIFLNQYRAMMPAARLLFVLYFLLGVVPELIFTVVNSLGIFGGTNATLVAEQLRASSSMVEIISLTLRSRQFRQGVLRLFGRNTSSVIAPESNKRTSMQGNRF